MTNSEQIALGFLNALHTKSHDSLAVYLGSPFQDVLPNGTIVKSAEQLLDLHVHFMADERTGFRPKNGEHRFFTHADFGFTREADDGSCGFYRITAEVDRPVDFREVNSDIIRLYMHLGIFVKGLLVEHVQNTLCDQNNPDPH